MVMAMAMAMVTLTESPYLVIASLPVPFVSAVDLATILREFSKGLGRPVLPDMKIMLVQPFV